MTDTEKEILGLLNELQSLAAGMKTAAAKPNLLPVFSRLDQLAQQLPPSADPQLRHYLHNKSYEKARLLLTGRGADNLSGSCGRH